MTEVLMIVGALMKGGMERQLVTFLEHYDRSKLRVSLLLYQKKIEYDIPPDVTVLNLHRAGKLDVLFFIRMLNQIRSKRYQVINSKITGINEQVMLLCGLSGRQALVSEVRDTGDYLLPYFRQMRRLYRLFRANWQIVANSRKACQEVQPFLPAYVQPIFIGNGIDTQRFSKAFTNKNADEWVVGFAGRAAPQKNIETLIQALAIVKPAIAKKLRAYLIVGYVSDRPYLDSLLAQIREAGLEENVGFMEGVNHMERYYNRFDIFVLPSFHEGTPNVLLEAMSCECPSLISTGANSDGFLTEEFVFSTENANQLAEKIKWLASLSEAERNVIGQQNRQYVESHYSVNTMVGKLTDLLVQQANKNSSESRPR